LDKLIIAVLKVPKYFSIAVLYDMNLLSLHYKTRNDETMNMNGETS
jgi:hypothetical protein